MATIEPPQETTSANGNRPKLVSVAGGRQIAYAEYGPPDGDPVVFFHGTPGSRCLGALLETAAEACGVRVLAPDRPGVGRSSPLPDRSIGDVADAVTTVLDDAGVGSAGLAAFSGGAPYAYGMASKHPDRTTRVDVVSGATPPDGQTETPALQRVLRALAMNTPVALCGLIRGQAWVAEHREPGFVVAQYTTPNNAEAVPDAAAAIVKDDFLEAVATSRRGVVTEFNDAATEWDVEFADIEADVGLWHGDDDTNVPIGGVRRLEGEIPTADLHVLEAADHLWALLRSIPEVLAKY